MPFSVEIRDPALRSALQSSGDRFWRRYGAVMQKRVLAAIHKIEQDPYNLASSHRLHGNFDGLRGVSVDGRLRLLIKICEECWRHSLRDQNPQLCCADDALDATRVNVVTLIDYHSG